jgi:hypothetical protein
MFNVLRGFGLLQNTLKALNFAKVHKNRNHLLDLEAEIKRQFFLT